MLFILKLEYVLPYLLRLLLLFIPLHVRSPLSHRITRLVRRKPRPSFETSSKFHLREHSAKRAPTYILDPKQTTEIPSLIMANGYVLSSLPFPSRPVQYLHRKAAIPGLAPSDILADRQLSTALTRDGHPLRPSGRITVPHLKAPFLRSTLLFYRLFASAWLIVLTMSVGWAGGAS